MQRELLQSLYNSNLYLQKYVLKLLYLLGLNYLVRSYDAAVVNGSGDLGGSRERKLIANSLNLEGEGLMTNSSFAFLMNLLNYKSIAPNVLEEAKMLISTPANKSPPLGAGDMEEAQLPCIDRISSMDPDHQVTRGRVRLAKNKVSCST